MTRDKYYCTTCSKLKTPDGPFPLEPGDKVNFPQQSRVGQYIRVRSVTGTVLEVLTKTALVRYKGENYQVGRLDVTPVDAPNALTYSFSELCECSKESVEDQPEATNVFQKISFEDNGQDFQEWVTKDGRVIDCQPFQAFIWVGCEVKITGNQLFFRNSAALDFHPMRHKVTQVTSVDPSYQVGFLAAMADQLDKERYTTDTQYKYGHNVALFNKKHERNVEL
jgi:hypothetical protein